jgi:hypothetical protein
MRGLGRTVLLVAALALAACSDSDSGSTATTGSDQTDLWAAPADPMALTVDAGLTPEVKEHLDHHVHAHLDVFLDGEPVTVPAGIGVDIDNPGVRQFDEGGEIIFGGIEECDEPCISPLHTHDETGIIHTESPIQENNTLGQFFVEWDQRLDADCVASYCSPDEDIAVYVDGERYEGDPADIELTDRLQIAIVIGAPPAEIPDTADFSKA